ncbi:hypothetical protein D9H55_00670 [Escherichia coli]|nr:hypothetical protein [Escherichia coli]
MNMGSSLFKDNRALLIFFGTALCFIFPIINADVYYRDDLFRAASGFYGWSMLGRPLTDVIMRVLTNSGDLLIDSSPYTYILSAASIAFASLSLKDYLDKHNVKNSTFTACLLIFNPLFVQNYLYVFDSLSMSLAFMAAVISYCFECNNKYLSLSIKVFMGVASLSLYQPCFNIFIALCMVDSAIYLIDKSRPTNDFIKQIFFKALSFLGSYSLYYLLIANVLIPNNSRSQTIFSVGNPIESLKSNIFSIYSMVSSFFLGTALPYFILGLVLVATSIALLLLSKRTTITHAILGLSVAIVAFLASILGPTYILANAPIMPRAVVTLSLLLVFISLICSGWMKQAKFLIALTAIPFIVISSHVSNIVSEQRKFEESMFTMIANDIVNSREDIGSVKIIGTAVVSPRAKQLIKEHGELRYFLSPVVGTQASFLLESKGIPHIEHPYSSQDEVKSLVESLKSDSSSFIIRNDLYSIYRAGRSVIVQLGK